MKTNKYIYKKAYGILCGLCFLCVLCVTTTSCEDMLDKGNDYVIYADDHILSNPADTTTSVLGIINKLQGIAVRTNLLGEVRADLVVVNENASTDLKDMATIEVDDDNAYNTPRDYYSVINNCNYFLAFADSTAGNVNRNEKYFEAEIAQVHSIRAWTYLQLAMVYGRVPFIVDPVLTKQQSEEWLDSLQHPYKTLDEVCDYFIQDLQPYYGKAYPDPGHFGLETLDPQMCFFPTQVVMGDLYLWRAALAGKGAGKAYAEAAAKAYYDYIVWDLSGKANLYTSSRNLSWSANSITNDSYKLATGSLVYQNSGRTAWGTSNSETITVIPMDSASAEGYYNELRNLYNTTHVIDWKEASISPSDALRDLSKEQVFVGYDNFNNVKAVTADKFTEEEINEGYLGDLRYMYNYSQETIKRNQQSISDQTIRKHAYQHVGIYRASQLYLRLAEALNYAGYPRFAKQILTMGLSNVVIENEVQPYYTTAHDTAFISYFDFVDADFKPYADRYTISKDSLGVITGVKPFSRSNTSECNMWGIHSRGSGMTFLNESYAPAFVPDSTSYPYTEASQVGKRPNRSDETVYEAFIKPTEPKKPSTWDVYGNETVSREVYKELNSTWYTVSRYNTYVNSDSVGTYAIKIADYMVELAEYEHKVDSVNAIYTADSAAYENRMATFKNAYNVWYAAAYGNPSFIEKEQAQVDSLILNEQALELAYEGNRFYDLMRRAYWYNDNTILSKAVANRDTSAGTRLQTRSNWFLRWKDKIGW